MGKEVFRKRSRVNAPVEDVFNWHAIKGALERLSPPWDSIRVIESKGGIEKGAEHIFEMKVGPFPLRWIARHED